MNAQRFRWIDQTRGAAILYLAVCNLIHWPKGNRLLEFFFTHPDRDIIYVMHFRDITTASFIFIMGFLYGYIFHRYKEKYGIEKAVRHVLFRYGLILFLGVLTSFVGSGRILQERSFGGGPSMTVVVWDVLQTIGLAGLVGFPFLFLKPKLRLFAGYGMVIFYQIMLSLPGNGWRLFAVYSVQGGILGTIFSFSAQLIIASALGEYYFSSAAKSHAKTYKALALFVAANLALGLVLAFVPNMGASKRQASLAYALISMGITVLAGMVFMLLEKKNKISFFLDAFGKNPFLVYLAVLGLEAVFYQVLFKKAAAWLQLTAGAAGLATVSWAAAEVYRRIGIIKTEKVALIALAITGIVAVIVIPIRIFR